MAEQKKLLEKTFYSSTGYPTPVWDRFGVNVVYVKPEGSVIDERFFRAAIAAHCSTDGFQVREEPEFEPSDPLDGIKEIILGMIKEPTDGDFTAAGMPSMPRLVKKAGYQVPREQMVAAWESVQEDLQKLADE